MAVFTHAKGGLGDTCLHFIQVYVHLRRLLDKLFVQQTSGESVTFSWCIQCMILPKEPAVSFFTIQQPRTTPLQASPYLGN